jgi:hypothetical protein
VPHISPPSRDVGKTRPQPQMSTLTLFASAPRTRKRLGEVAEAAFLHRAAQLGFSVLIPWGDSNRYDSAVDLNHGLNRIQVKSAGSRRRGRYHIKTSGTDGHIYTLADIDFLVGYVVPCNLWYIIPVEAIGTREAIAFYPDTRRPFQLLFERYREAWCLLDCPRKNRGWNDIPVLCRSREVGTRCQVCPLHNDQKS